MSILGVDFKGLADELIGSLKYPCVVKHRSAGTFDPLTSQMTQGLSVDYAGFCVSTNISADFGKTSAVPVEQGDQLFLLTASCAPAVGDVLFADGLDWRILQVFKVAPNGEVIMYKAHVRK